MVRLTVIFICLLGVIAIPFLGVAQYPIIAPPSISVSTSYPGASPENLEHFGESTPMGRPGQPHEVAPAFLFLACEDASYMSGQVLHPNGGTIING